jgi:hypothetical protein
MMIAFWIILYIVIGIIIGVLFGLSMIPKNRRVDSVDEVVGITGPLTGMAFIIWPLLLLIVAPNFIIYLMRKLKENE